MSKKAGQKTYCTLQIDQHLPQRFLESLKVGTQLTGRVIHDFGNQHYLFRMMGRNLVLWAEIPLQMREDVTFVVKSRYPRIHLSPVAAEKSDPDTHLIHILA